MQSSGGLAEAHAFQGKDAILSGPGRRHRRHGAHRRARLARDDGKPIQVIGFDMGGTSTDVSHYAGEFERAFETQVAGVRMRAPMMASTPSPPAAARSSRFDGARFRVGPQSAGANPGPACYRRGGPLTVTDANVDARQDPAGVLPARVRAARRPAARRATSSPRASPRSPARSRAATGTARAPEAVAEGFIDIAVGSMANAIKKISVARGYDVTRYTLQCFGGAGGQHACRVADALGMTRVFVHPLAGVLSAYGMGLADQTVMREAAIELPLAGALAAVAARLDALAAEAVGRARAPGRRARRGSASTAASTCATKAPTRRSSCRSATRPGCRRPSRRRTASASPS